ncbi:hypothetical protein [Anaerosporobacter sp.]|uniref:hypothetical protein n=1 Tax=Anaerosporobacter sp. TaxID=1872529 RepID=UPI00286F0F25|nr:hypothetical protein [Anaerosporobacter sp.]
MQYFLIEQDMGYARIPRFKDLHQQLHVWEIKQGNYYKIPKRMLFRLEEDKDTLFVDIIAGPIFMVSELLQTLLIKFEPTLGFKEFILLDQGNGITETYYMPTLEEIDCLSEQSEFDMMHVGLRKIVIEEEKVQDKSIFVIGGVKKRYVIARLDVVESMIRREAIGFAITEVEVV